MKQVGATSDGGSSQRALAACAPAGLHLRVEADGGGDGPFRTQAHVRTVVDVDVVRPWIELRARELAVFALVLAATLWLTAVGLWAVAIAVAAAVAIRGLWSSGDDRPTVRLFTIHDDHIALPGGDELALADVMDVHVRPEIVGRVPFHEVICATPTGDVVIGMLATEEHADHVQHLVESAVDSHQRRVTS